MLNNLGLFVLVWETLAVVLAIPLRLGGVIVGTGGLAMAGLAVLPVALAATWWLARGPLARLDRLAGGGEQK